MIPLPCIIQATDYHDFDSIDYAFVGLELDHEELGLTTNGKYAAILKMNGQTVSEFTRERLITEAELKFTA